MSGASQRHFDNRDTHHSNSADGVSLTALLQKYKKRFAPGSALKQEEARLHDNGKVSIIIDLQGVTLWKRAEVS